MYAVVVENRAAFVASYPAMTLRIAGKYLGILSRSGEELKFSAAGLGTVVAFVLNSVY